MLKFRLILIFVIITGLSPIISFSQNDPELDMEEDIKVKVPEKIIDPQIRLWYLKGFGAFRDSTQLDTLQDNFHLYHPIYKDAISISELGNYATPYLNNDFFNRDSKMDFFFLKTREAYLITPGSILYYNTRTPYSQLDYSQSEN